MDEQDPNQALSSKNWQILIVIRLTFGRRKLWLKHYDFCYSIVSLSNDQERSGQPFVSLDLDIAPPLGLQL